MQIGFKKLTTKMKKGKIVNPNQPFARHYSNSWIKCRGGLWWEIKIYFVKHLCWKDLKTNQASYKG